MTVRVVVVGAGHLGRIHARLLRGVESAELVGVCDPRKEAAQAVAQEACCAAFADWREAPGRIDAAILAVPTVLHHKLGLELLEKGVSLLIEKPLAANAAEGEALVRTARKHGCLLQVGHVERFNPAWKAAAPHIRRPKYIEAARTSSYTFRSTDIGVVLDLMIHDLELILSLDAGAVERVDALGISVFGRHEDIAQARITFDSGCVANLTASRASYRVRRAMQVYCKDSYFELDFAGPTAKAIHPDPRLLGREIDFFGLDAQGQADVRQKLFEDLLPLRDLPIEPGNAILQEQQDFVASLREGRSPIVHGAHAQEAIAVAERVLHEIASHRWDGAKSGLRGPLATPAPAALPVALPIAVRDAREAQRRKAG